MMRETRFPVSPKERQAVRQAAAFRGWEKRRERDEAVTVNLPADMLPLWEKTRAQFKGTAAERCEAFLQFAHEQGDGAVIEALIDASDARLTGMMREFRTRFASDAGDAGADAGADADAGDAGIAYEAGFAGWLAEVGIGDAGAGEALGADAGAGEALGADAGAGEALGAGAGDAGDEVTAVMARPAFAVTLFDFDDVTAVMAAPVLAGADVTSLDFDADEVTAVMARPGGAWLVGATLADLDGVIVLGADDADVTIVDAV